MPPSSLRSALLLTGISVWGAMPLQAQAYDTVAVRKAVLAVVDSALGFINTGNMTGLSDMMTADGQVYAARERDGVGGAFTMRTAASQRATAQRPPIIERGFNPTVHLAGTIASVWLPYDLWAEGKWSHCGIDHFTLVKVGSAWRIVNLTYTIEQPPSCRMHPDGVPPGQKPPVPQATNPVIPGWYADPEAHVFNGQYWLYPTYSAPYNQQLFLDAFSSTDLVTWTKHARILDTTSVRWARRAIWAPSIVQKDDWYYLFFGANDIQNDQEHGGIGVARSRSPQGPFVDYLGKPLIDRFHNGAQPIDQFVFRDHDGAYYIVYGGWRHCNIARLNADFTGFIPFADGQLFKEITPKGYVEGAFMLRKDNKYYFMWSEGGWTGPDYAVAYAVGDSPFGPFERVGTILKQDSTVATGAGHHSVFQSPSTGKWYIAYHRRPLGERDRNARVVSIESLHFDEKGFIRPVVLTTTGVAADPIKR